MKKILSYMKNTSIGMQLLSVFITIGLAIGSMTAVVFGLSYRTMERHEQYLEYISTISQLSKITDKSEWIINEMFYKESGNDADEEDNKLQITQATKEAANLISAIRLETTSVNISLRLRVVAYLFQQYESKALGLTTLLTQKEETEENSKAVRHDAYLEVIEILKRINAYIQEMISWSIKENEVFLQETSRRSQTLQCTLAVMLGLIISLTMYLGFRYSRYLQQLIGKILRLTKRISEGNKVEILEVEEGPEEIREMTSGFNKLIMTMEELNRKADEKAQLELKLAEEKLEKSRMSELLKEAQLQGLQFQIQPHFLFNTLNVISMMAIMENNLKVYDLIMSLSRFMRGSLKKTTALVSLEEELDMVGQYLYILKARLGDKLDYEITNKLDESLEIPPFTLQPIVENAFRHGIEEKIENGRIIVRITKRNERIVLRIFNDGTGMKKEELAALRKRCSIQEIHMDQEKHIGIENVVYRLNMLFPKAVQYKVYSSARRGTLFSIEILQ